MKFNIFTKKYIHETIPNYILTKKKSEIINSEHITAHIHISRAAHALTAEPTLIYQNDSRQLRNIIREHMRSENLGAKGAKREKSRYAITTHREQLPRVWGLRGLLSEKNSRLMSTRVSRNMVNGEGGGLWSAGGG